RGRTARGHGLLEATHRIYQVTPDIPDRRRATKQDGSQALARPTASMRASSPPVGTISTASDVTDDPIQTASLIATADGARAPPDRELARADVVPMHRTQRVRPSGASVGRPRRASQVAFRGVAQDRRWDGCPSGGAEGGHL